MMVMKQNFEVWGILLPVVMGVVVVPSSEPFYLFEEERYFIARNINQVLMFLVLILVIAICWQYDEAREYVERARKCLATELAALVSLVYKLFLLILFLGIDI